MNRHLRRAVALAPLLATLASLAAAGCGGGAEPAGPVATAAWARPTPAMVTVGAAYLRLRSRRDDRLLEVTVPDSVAARAELHEVTRDAAGGMGMRRLEALALPAGRVVELRPGAAHIMLLELRRPLVEGDVVALALRFEHAPPETLRALVRAR
jgi:periplasmic copper chaperone A